MYRYIVLSLFSLFATSFLAISVPQSYLSRASWMLMTSGVTALFTGANMAVEASLYSLVLKPARDGRRLICERVLLKRRITSDYDKTLQVWLALKCHRKH